jgi:hypothetical protein
MRKCKQCQRRLFEYGDYLEYGRLYLREYCSEECFQASGHMEHIDTFSDKLSDLMESLPTDVLETLAEWGEMFNIVDEARNQLYENELRQAFREGRL